jgi:RHS repeat-associated protein
MAVTVLAEVAPPVVSLDGIEPDTICTGPRLIHGSIASLILRGWRLETRRRPGPGGTPADWFPIGEGTEPCEGGGLAWLDPTVLPNGYIELRLTATDLLGRTTATPPVEMLLDGELKPGRVVLSFMDLSVPVAGIPITVVRTYDSLRAQVGECGDFGVGWSLEIRGARVEVNRPLGGGWSGLNAGGWYALASEQPHRVTVTFPNRRAMHFRPLLNPGLQFGYPIASVRMGFTNLPGTLGALCLEESDRAEVDGFLGPVELISFSSLQRFAPRRFRLTTVEGFSWVLDTQDGVCSVTDPHHNSVSVSADGLCHSGGWNVPFVRDPQGRIVRILDHAGQSFEYDYDVHGNLLRFTNPGSEVVTFAYDAQHRLTQVMDARGIVVARLEYDDQGRLRRQTDAPGHAIEFTHDLVHRQEFVADRLGQMTIHELDRRGNVVRTTDPLGHTRTWVYNEHDQCTEETDALGRTTRFEFDARQDLVAITNPMGETTLMAFDDHHRLVRVTDPLGHSVSHEYDAAGSLVRTTNPLGHVTEYAYDNRGFLLSVTDPLGHTTRFERDAMGLVVRQVDALGHALEIERDALGNPIRHSTVRGRSGGWEAVVQEVAFDPLRRPVRLTSADGSVCSVRYHPTGEVEQWVDPLGRVVSVQLDSVGRPCSIVLPDGSTASATFDPEGRVLTACNPLGQVTRFIHDPLGRLVRVVHPDGTIEDEFHDAEGQRVARTDRRGHTTWFGYDLAGRLVSITNALGQVTRLNRDAAGRVIAVTDPDGLRTGLEYDPRGQLTQILFADETTVGFTYDPAGRLNARTETGGGKTLFAHDAAGRLVAVTNPLGHTTRYAYNELGWLTAVTDARQNVTTHDYDATGRRLCRILPTGETERFEYDLGGRMTRHTAFSGEVTTFEYDWCDRLLGRYPDPGRAEPPVTFEYDTLGRRLGMTDAVGTTRYSYSAGHQLVARTVHFHAQPQGDPWSASVQIERDANGNIVDLRSSLPNGADFGYEYDALDRLVAVHDRRLGTTRYSFGAGGSLERVDLPNGVSVVHEHDARRRVTNSVAWTSAGLVAQFRASYGTDGLRRSATDTLWLPGGPGTDERAWQYDPARRLTRETVSGDFAPHGSLEFELDAVGNRLRQTSSVPGMSSGAFTYDGADRLLGDLYDVNGNTAGGWAGHGGWVECGFDSANRLRTAVLTDGTRFEWVRDGDGRRVIRRCQPPGGELTSTWFLADELNPTGYTQLREELVSSWSGSAEPVVTRVHTWGHQLIAQDQLLNGGWTASFHGHDGRRNVRLLLDPEGRITDHYHYDAFGNLLGGGGSTPNPHRFKAEVWEAGVGLYHLRARELNPQTGRFWTRDPFEGYMEEPSSLHPYGYVSGDPVNQWDPSGLRTLAEAQVTVTIASLIHSMAVHHGIDTLLRGQEELSHLGLAGPELMDAVELALAYQLFADSYAIFNVGRLAPGLYRFAAARLGPALDHLHRLTPRQWLHLHPGPGGALSGNTGRGVGKAEYGVSFFDRQIAQLMVRSSALGRHGQQHFFMPVSDSAFVRTAYDASRYSGRAPSTDRALLTGQSAYGLAFPTAGMTIRAPTPTDAGHWAHFLPGGHTAVRTSMTPTGAYLLNPVHEFVTPGGGPIPRGSVLFQLGAHGEWIMLKRW